MPAPVVGEGTAHGVSSPTACSVLWDHAGASAYATAAVARFFVALEQPGPWGRNAVRESHLGTELGTELDTRCADRSGRFVLLRRPGSHPDAGGPVTVLVAHAGAVPAGAWLLRAHVDHPRTLLDLDWDALALGDRGAVAASLPGAADAPPSLLVCTNGRRDVCCAIRGRPIAAAAAAHAPGRVWESSHTGGHRFAPTGVLLPWGQTYARLTTGLAAEILDTSLSGRTPRTAIGPLHDRGRSPHQPAAQCAESTVRAALGEQDLASLWIETMAEHRGEPEPGLETHEASGEAADAALAPRHDVVVRHRDGRRWLVVVVRTDTGQQRPESCGKPPVPALDHHAIAVTELTPEHPDR